MILEYQILELVVDEFRWLVIIALYLVTDDVYLVAYLLLWINTTEDDVTQQVYRLVQMVFQDSRIEYRIFLIGKGIEVTAHTLQTIQYLQGRALLSTLKSCMFAEMSQPILTQRLLTGTRIDADTTVDYL